MIDPLHPRYGEPGAIYGQVYYSAGPANNQTKKGNRMAEVKINLTRMNPDDLITDMKNHAALAAPAAPAPPAPPPTPPIDNMAGAVTSLNAKITAAETANNAYKALKAQLAQAKDTRDNAADALRDEAKLFIKKAESESQGNAGQLQAIGFQIASTTQTPSAPVPKLSNLAVTAGDVDRTLDATVDPPSGVPVKTYEWQYTTVDPINGPFVNIEPTTASNTQLTELTSGQRVWVRVRGVNPNGPGPWSDPFTKIVP